MEDEGYFPDNRIRTHVPNVLLMHLEYKPMTLSEESCHRQLLFLSMGLEQIERVGDSEG